LKKRKDLYRKKRRQLKRDADFIDYVLNTTTTAPIKENAKVFTIESLNEVMKSLPKPPTHNILAHPITIAKFNLEGAIPDELMNEDEVFKIPVRAAFMPMLAEPEFRDSEINFNPRCW